MKNTEKIYDKKPYCSSFTAQVLSCVRCDQGYRVVLDRSAFFPGGGGQEADRGTLNGDPLLSIFEEKGIVYHILPCPVTVGKTVRGELDWEFRYTNMQNHSGEHILSGIVHAEKGYDNVGFHMNDRFITVDFNGPLTADELAELELRANQRICDNLPITVTHHTPEELEGVSYRSKKELSGDIRIVQVGDVDTCACCAPHVERTGEVGVIKIVAHENYKGGVRLTVLCGARAVKRFQQQTDTLAELSALYSATPDKLTDAVKHEQDEIASLKETVSRLSDELIDARVKDLSRGRANIFHVETSLDEIAARKLTNRLAVCCTGRACVLVPQTAGGFRYILASAHEDVRPFTKQFNERFAGRGGGSETMTQGSASGDLAEMKRMVEE